MGIYFLIAIALSAMSAATDVQVSRPVLRAASESRVRAARAIRNVTAALRRVRPSRAAAIFVPIRDRRIDAPLSGAASPRAPAFGC
jgi:hypothetical protein